MANKLTDMSKIRKVIKLYCRGNSKQFISNYLSLSRNTVKKYISLFELEGLSFEWIENKSDSELEELFCSGKAVPVNVKLDALYSFFPQMERELKKVGVTVAHMWEKYIALHPDGLGSTQFRHHYKTWSKRVNCSMHMDHKSGDKMYIDYAGKTLSIIDAVTGESKEVQFFVAILGASQYTYAEASKSQKKEDFVCSVENAMRFFGGVPAAIVPDNLKSAVTKSCRYEPEINETLQDLADHYQTTILPARCYKPQDKALVENVIKILYTRVHAHLHGKEYYSIEDLNKAIATLMDAHNRRKLTARPYSRLDVFTEDEKQELRPLPNKHFEIRYQSFATVMQNGHVQLSEDKNYYSVPYQYIRKKVKLSYTSGTVEIYYKYNRIALHKRNYKHYVYTTTSEHLASTHRFVSQWSAERFIEWAEKIDSSVKEYIVHIIESRTHPEQAYKSCMGILGFEKKAGRERLIGACKRALDFEVYSFKAIQKILENNLDTAPFEDHDHELPDHHNIRGKHYYN